MDEQIRNELQDETTLPLSSDRLEDRVEHFSELLKMAEDENAKLRALNAELLDALLTVIRAKLGNRD